MEQSTMLIIICVSITLVLFSSFYYANKKFMTMQASIESLQNQILDQQKIIERQEKLLKQVFRGTQPESFGPPLMQTPPPFVPNQNLQPSPQNPLLSMSPMMDGLMGMLNSLPISTPHECVNHNKEQEVMREEDINKEIKKELEELNVPKKEEIKEGRIEKQEEVVN